MYSSFCQQDFFKKLFFLSTIYDELHYKASICAIIGLSSIDKANLHERKENMKLLELFITFFKIGIVTFGGGYAMLPLIEAEIVNNKKWIAPEDMYNMLAISQSIPGAIAINMATLVGYRRYKKIGAIISTIGVITPSYLIIVIFANLIIKLQQYPEVDSIFMGINGAVAALILIAGIKIIKSSVKTGLAFFIMSCSFGLILFFKINPIYVILGFSALAILQYKWAAKYRD